jgi:hypothetical protein
MIVFKPHSTEDITLKDYNEFAKYINMPRQKHWNSIIKYFPKYLNDFIT